MVLNRLGDWMLTKISSANHQYHCEPVQRPVNFRQREQGSALVLVGEVAVSVHRNNVSMALSVDCENAVLKNKKSLVGCIPVGKSIFTEKLIAQECIPGSNRM